MNKAELGEMVCYMWNNADQAPLMDNVETAYKNCSQKAQMELLEIFTSHVKDNPQDWLDKPEYVRKAIEKAEKLFK